MSGTEFGYPSRSASPARERMEAAGRLAEARRDEAARALASEAAASRRHAADIEALKRGMEALAADLERLRQDQRADRLASGALPSSSRGPGRPSIKAIQRLVCRHYDVTELDLLSDRRQRALIEPRHIAMYLCKQMTPASLPEIGRHFGGRDHTTIIHAVKHVERMLKQQPAIGDVVARLTAMLAEDPARPLNAWQGPPWAGDAAAAAGRSVGTQSTSAAGPLSLPPRSETRTLDPSPPRQPGAGSGSDAADKLRRDAGRSAPGRGESAPAPRGASPGAGGRPPR